jgi:GLPGLI family protein
MKHAFIITAFSIVLSLNSAFSQGNVMNQGHLQYDIVVKALKPEQQQAADLLYGASMNIFFTPNNSRVDFSMGQMMTQTMIVDEKLDKALSITLSKFGNFAVIGSLEEMKFFTKKQDTLSKVEFVNEEKVILGYKCKKALVKGNNLEEVVYWYTEDIALNMEGQMIQNSLIPGVPLEFTANADGMSMSFKASNLEEKVENMDSKFALVAPAGVNILTIEQYKYSISNPGKKVTPVGPQPNPYEKVEKP